MPEELAGGRYLRNGLSAHRGQADRGVVIDSGRRTPATPTPLIISAAPKGGGCGGMNTRPRTSARPWVDPRKVLLHA
jgi:hypothetical protein